MTAPLPTWSTLTHPQRLSLLPSIIASHTAEQAAQQLGTTKNAIIGFCGRNGILLGNTVRAKAANDNQRPVVAGQPPAAPSDQAAGLNVLLLERAERGCKWPTTGSGAAQRYCGLHAGRSSYCSVHSKATSPRPKDKYFVFALQQGRIPVGTKAEVSLEHALAVVCPRNSKIEGFE